MFNTGLKLELVETKLRLEAEREKVAAANEKLKAAAATVAQLDEYKERLSSMEWHLRIEKDQKQDYFEQIHKLDKEKAVLLERLDLVANYGITNPPTDPKHVPEDVEDAEHALRTGLINKSEFEKLLEEHGFQNNEVDVFSNEDYPRLGTR